MPSATTPPRLPHTFMPALLVSLALSVVCAGGLYYVLAQHDRVRVAAQNAAMDRAAEEQARAVARTFAWFTERLLEENPAEVQRAIDVQLRHTGILDAAVIGDNNVILAAKASDTVGQRLRDSSWLTARQTRGEVTAKGLAFGRPAVTIVEPLRDHDRSPAWLRLVFSLPQEHEPLRTAENLAFEVSLYVVPYFLLVTAMLSLTLRGILSQVRLLIARVVNQAFEPEGSMAGQARRPRMG